MRDDDYPPKRKKILVPKIIHLLVPDDRKKWHPVWKPCEKSVLTHHPGQWVVTYWRDTYLDNYITNYWPDWWDVWHNFPIDIVKLDIARYIIMYEFGGIYADMDTYFYKNFHKDLNPDTIYLAPGTNNTEIVQNSLLASTGRNMFWREVIHECFKRIKNFTNPELAENRDPDPNSPFQIFVRRSAGCEMLSEMYDKLHTEYKIEILDRSKYQVQPDYYDPNVVTRHMLTGRWGNQAFEDVVRSFKKKYPDMSVQDIFKKDYKEFRNIDIDTIDWN